MSYIVASLPPMKCFVKREFLYNDHKGHGELEPAIWVSIKALRGQVFLIESLLPFGNGQRYARKQKVRWAYLS